jgi:hypothetical protein
MDAHQEGGTPESAEFVRLTEPFRRELLTRCCLRFVSRFLGSAGDWRMLRTILNGQPAVASYLRGADGAHRAFGVAALDITPTGIASIVFSTIRSW